MIVRYFASVRAAAGVGEEVVEADSVGAALAVVRSRHDATFERVLGVCSFVVDGAPVGSRDPDVVPVAADSVLDCLPPFAGG